MTNPIVAFGAKQRMRSVRTPILLTLYAVVLAALAYFTVYAPFMGDTIRISSMRSSVNGYGFLLIAQFGLLVLVAPAMTAGSISGERERQTLDLLLVTNTGSTRIVFGKLWESFGFLALLILCSLPMLSLVLLTGGASFVQVLVSILFLMLTALAGLSVGLCCSAFIKRTVAATVTAYLMMLLIGAVTLIPLWYDVHRIDMLYQELSAANQGITQIDYQSIAFSLNPALGLFSLLRVQLGMFDSVLWNFSYTLANTVSYLPFERYLTVNMIFMGVASMALCGVAVLKMRPQKRSVRK
ncbi:MAG: ABC transporter permease [Eubacteriales bacterium]|nr:ABC transporter permease [Eubacteriales bacterium]